MLRRSHLHSSRAKHSLQKYLYRRAFSISPKPRLIDDAVSAAHDIFQYVHTGANTWMLALPCVAFSLRFLVLGPVSLYVHGIRIKRQGLIPLTFALRHATRKDVIRNHGAEGPRVCEAIVRKRMTKKLYEMSKTAGTEGWKTWLGLVQIPIWLTMIEALRRMCGVPDGLLGIVQKSLAKLWNWGAEMDNTVQGESTEEAVSASAEASKMVPQVTGNISIEPTLATEGMLWLPNLLVSDPYGILSIILTCSIWANVGYAEQKSRLVSPEPSKWRQRLTRGMLVLGVGVGFATLQLPSAMLVYWISSSGSALCFSVLLEKYRPLARPFVPRKIKPFEIRHKIDKDQ